MQVGDQVLSRDPDTGKDAVKTVTGTISRPADTLVTLSLVDPTTNQASTMTCTPEHPVYVQGSGWIEAGDLVKGNSIVTRTGAALTVVSLQWQSDETGKHPFTVYNLTVEDDHTYFAGDFDGGLWVHNCKIVNGDKAGTTHKDVPWKENGFPDFRDFLYDGADGENTVEIEYTGSRAKDFAAANKAAGFTDGTPEGYTWHHVEDMKTMQLVETGIHRSVGHTGGFGLSSPVDPGW